MSLGARIRLAGVLSLVLVACSGDPGGPSTGTLSVSIVGLPNGSSASVDITGPNGFVQTLTTSQSLTGLSPGVYTVAAGNVTVGAAIYSATPPTQTVAVVGGTPATASVSYVTTTGNLAVNITGVGTNGNAAVSVTGPAGYNRTVSNSKTLIDLVPGSYTVTATNVTASCGGTTYTATPASQSVAVVANATANADVSYTSPSGGPVNLCIDGMYLTQSAQTYAGSIPLVRNRAGLVRVFVVANQASTPATGVQVQLRVTHGITVDTFTQLPPAGMAFVPTAPNESSLSNSWNFSIPGTTVETGVQLEAEVIPPGTLVESDPGDNIFTPATPPVVRSVPTVNVTLVPIAQPGGLTGNATDANKDAFLDVTRRMHPIDGVNVVVRSTPITTTTTLQANGTGWQTVLDLVDAIAAADGTRYYYGVAKVSYSSGVAGVAYVSQPLQPARAALGWDHLQNASASVVAAHELGHNWGRNHAPCGGPTGLDPNYPEPDGSTGGYGYDRVSGQVEPPTSGDIMGYCDPKWISSYTYSAVMDYLTANPFVAGGPGAAQAVQPCLLLWGYIEDGRLTLRPAFQVTTRPSLPQRAGPYTIEARAGDGATLFAHSFSPAEIADIPGTHRSFAFAVPLSPALAARLSSLRLRGEGQETVVTAPVPTGTPAATEPALRRTAGGGAALGWDHQVYPMVMVRDADTGEILSIADGGSLQLPLSKRQVDLVLSDGVKSVTRRVGMVP
jgi:hypothetical protein